MNNEKNSSLYCMPVEATQGHYAMAREWLASNLSLIPETELRESLQEKFERKGGVVLIAGSLCQTTVYIPKDNDDFCYVIVDSENKPFDSETQTKLISESFLEDYLQRITKDFGHSEGILPEQRSYLITDYLDRTCEFHLPSGKRRVSDWRAVARGSRLLLVGQAGAGKTTLLRRIAIGLANDDFSSDDYRLPIYIQLRNWNENRSIERLVQHELAVFSAGDFSANYFQLTKSGRLLFLFDGFDEIATERRTKALDDLKCFMRKNLTCRFVVSTRPSVIPKIEDFDFTECILKDLSTSQVQELCWRKFSEKEKFSEKNISWKSFWTRLDSEPDVADLSKNPLILTLLIAKFVRDSLSPHFVGEVLSAAIDALTDEWDSVRGVRRNIEKTLTPKLQLALLRHLAVNVSSKGRSEFTYSDYLKMMDGMAINESPRIVLQQLEEQTGLVCKTKKNTWKFSHQTVQDYLYSAQLSGESASTLKLDPLNSEMVWRYACWNVSDASELLRSKLTAPYCYEHVMSATKALTQNLFVHTDVIRAYSLSTIWLLEKLCSGLEIVFFENEDVYVKNIKFSCRLTCLVSRESDLYNLKNLLLALHNARDGVANRELRQRIENSRIEIVKNFSPILNGEGHLKCEVKTIEAIASLTICYQS